MGLYVGARLHGVLAALAQDVPFLAVDEYFSDEIASSKIRELLVDADLEACWTSPYLPVDPARKLRALAEQRPSFSAFVEAARRALADHHDALVRAITP
jgi:polysaccharide pyruvyl transferase WcaK-like protein